MLGKLSNLNIRNAESQTSGKLGVDLSNLQTKDLVSILGLNKQTMLTAMQAICDMAGLSDLAKEKSEVDLLNKLKWHINDNLDKNSEQLDSNTKNGS